MGPFDLGNNIGHSIIDGTMHGELKQAVAKIQRAAKENEKSSGIYATSGDQAREFADQGFNMVSPWRPLLTVGVREGEAASAKHYWYANASPRYR